jgi:hypothetical protein
LPLPSRARIVFFTSTAGAVLSSTVTRKEALLALPALSVAV